MDHINLEDAIANEFFTTVHLELEGLKRLLDQYERGAYYTSDNAGRDILQMLGRIVHQIDEMRENLAVLRARLPAWEREATRGGFRIIEGNKRCSTE